MRLILLTLLLAAALPAHAQQAAPPARPDGPPQPVATIIAEPVAMMIAAFDRDGDARVTRAEFDAGLRASWPAGDAALGFVAYADWAERWLGDRNALPGPFEVDRNGDNRVTLAEVEQRFALFFARFDANRDGAILRAELLTRRTPPMMAPGRRRGNAPDQRPR